MLYGAVETTLPPAEGDLLLNTLAMYKIEYRFTTLQQSV